MSEIVNNYIIIYVDYRNISREKVDIAFLFYLYYNLVYKKSLDNRYILIWIIVFLYKN